MLKKIHIIIYDDILRIILTYETPKILFICQFEKPIDATRTIIIINNIPTEQTRPFEDTLIGSPT